MEHLLFLLAITGLQWAVLRRFGHSFWPWMVDIPVLITSYIFCLQIPNMTQIKSQIIKQMRPVNLHPLFLKIGHPAFWKMGHPAFCKKQAEKNRVILYSKREETRLPLLFLNYNDLGFLHSVFSKSRVPDFQKAGWPIFKNSGCRLTGRISNVKINKHPNRYVVQFFIGSGV